jgi:release factor glutamine methyltransferase
MRYRDTPGILAEELQGLYPPREIDSIGRLVLEYLTGSSWVQIRLNQDSELTPDQEIRISDIICRLKKHEPIQYILGETEFYGLKLKVRSGVLIPRGETEELVEWILEKAQGSRLKAQAKEQGSRLKAQAKAQGSRLKAQGKAQAKEQGSRLKAQGKVEEEKKVRILDIGCGSGAIAIALAKHLPAAEIIASDISPEALQLTKENGTLNQVEFLTTFLDILEPCALSLAPSLAPCALRLEPSLAPCALSLAPSLAPCALRLAPSLAPFDVIVSNPPYVPHAEMTSMDSHVVEYEPEIALFVPDNDPLVFYKAIAEFASVNLKPDGQVFVEIHDPLGEETAGVFRKWFSKVELRKDIHGKDRMIRASNG